MNQILKLSFVFAAISLFSLTAKADVANEGAEFKLQVGKVGAHVMGKTQDGEFFATSCKEHWGLNTTRGWYSYYTASMAFPNSMGDIVYTIRSAGYATEHSSTLELTSAAADKLCVHTEGAYTIRIVKEGEKQKVDVVDFTAKALPKWVQLPVGTVLQVQTGLVGQKIVAATATGDYYAIMCDAGAVMSSTANFLYPNYLGKIIIKTEGWPSKSYDSYAFGRVPESERANYMPMTKKAMSQICNHPNGLYTLRVDGTLNEKVMELVGEKDFQADTRAGGRGY